MKPLNFSSQHGQIGKRPRTERVPKTVTSWILMRLKKFTDYQIIVYAANYYGMTMSEIVAKTGEDGKLRIGRGIEYLVPSSEYMYISFACIFFFFFFFSSGCCSTHSPKYSNQLQRDEDIMATCTCTPTKWYYSRILHLLQGCH